MTKYWIKPVGLKEPNHIKAGEVFDESIERMNFSLKQPKSVVPGDILIVYAIGDGMILSYFQVISEPFFAKESDPFWQTWMSRWPWYVLVENLSPKFGKEWWKYSLKFSRLKEYYIRSHPQRAISINGSQKLGSLNYGSDKAQIDPEFAGFLIEKIQYVSAL